MALHHATLKAAIAMYAILLTQRKEEAEIKAEIAKDPKEFSPEDVDEIYNAIVNPKPQKPKVIKYIVATSFRDINDFSKEHEVGKDVSDFDPTRLESLVANSHVEKVEVEE